MQCIGCSFGHYIAKRIKMIQKKAHYSVETVDFENMLAWSGSVSTKRTYTRRQRELQEVFKVNP